MSDLSGDRAAEQSHLDVVYARLDEIIEAAQFQLTAIRRTGSVGTPQARSERDAMSTTLEYRIAQLRAVQDRLCFGRLDLRGGERHHIGRIGLSDDRQDKLLVDWRAPVAAPFYQATPAAPGDVVRRRHLTTSGREVVHLDDEVLDLSAIDEGERATLQGEGALMAAVRAPRTGRMGDIVATIQAEQDQIVRDELAGVLVVQGGPGTGKTAVALHRAAYLLFTYRQRLERSGVLVVGPGPLFLRYIEQVLPSLGESGVVMATPGSLFPGVEASRDDDDAVSRVKGDLRMVDVLANAVRDRQRLPDEDVQLSVGSHRILLTRSAVATARTRARSTGAPHNAARVTFVKDMLRHLAGQLAQQMGQTLSDDLRQELDADLRDSRDVRVNLNLLWMPLTPQRFLQDLFATPVRLASAATNLTDRERELLERDREQPFTLSDVPLLDEVAELVGDDGEAARAQDRLRSVERAAELEYAKDVLGMTGLVSPDLPGFGAEMLADQFAALGPAMSVAERAESDRSWVYGHLVVDEAQELSPMMWRLLARRCPARSWTVVGDLAQRGSAAGAASWREALDPVVYGRWRERQLSVSYRTPGRVLAVADAMARANDLPVTVVQSVREGEVDPAVRQREPGDARAVADVVASLLTASEEGTIAVVAPAGEVADLGAALEARWPGQVGNASRAALSVRVSVLAPEQVKGLEFDDVVVVEPAAVVAQSRRGLSDLYVALSRPTRRLVVVHSEPLPAGMDGLVRW
ncbi:HelD family protein [Angustibacter sp. McL0619]|uniref:HelD family protein n=1 Tax=Angustibacter sp. McL0619 TaxID=3415676 RepID=UPI003CE6A417